MDNDRRPVSADSGKNLNRKKQGGNKTVPEKASGELRPGDSREALNELL